MATNLVSLIMKFLTPDMIGRIASTLGLDRNDASTAVSAGVPALLAGLVGATTKPGGPQKIVDAAKQEMGMLDKFSGMLGAAGATSVADRGSSLLASLLGDRDQTALANSVGKYSGLGSAASDSVLGLLTPLVMGCDWSTARLARPRCRKRHKSSHQPKGQYSRGNSFGLWSIARRNRSARLARRYGKKSGYGRRRNHAGRSCVSRANLL